MMKMGRLKSFVLSLVVTLSFMFCVDSMMVLIFVKFVCLMSMIACCVFMNFVMFVLIVMLFL